MVAENEINKLTNSDNNRGNDVLNLSGKSSKDISSNLNLQIPNIGQNKIALPDINPKTNPINIVLPDSILSVEDKDKDKQSKSSEISVNFNNLFLSKTTEKPVDKNIKRKVKSNNLNISKNIKEDKVKINVTELLQNKINSILEISEDIEESIEEDINQFGLDWGSATPKKEADKNSLEIQSSKFFNVDKEIDFRGYYIDFLGLNPATLVCMEKSLLQVLLNLSLDIPERLELYLNMTGYIEDRMLYKGYIYKLQENYKEVLNDANIKEDDKKEYDEIIIDFLDKVDLLKNVDGVLPKDSSRELKLLLSDYSTPTSILSNTLGSVSLFNILTSTLDKETTDFYVDAIKDLEDKFLAFTDTEASQQVSNKPTKSDNADNQPKQNPVINTDIFGNNNNPSTSNTKDIENTQTQGNLRDKIENYMEKNTVIKYDKEKLKRLGFNLDLIEIETKLKKTTTTFNLLDSSEKDLFGYSQLVKNNATEEADLRLTNRLRNKPNIDVRLRGLQYRLNEFKLLTSI